jgi:hypothetical protein
VAVASYRYAAVNGHGLSGCSSGAATPSWSVPAHAGSGPAAPPTAVQRDITTRSAQPRAARVP